MGMEAPYHGTIMERPAEPGGRIAAVGHQLIEVHLWLREELDRLRDDVDSYLEGRGVLPSAGRSLRAHCLTFCSAVRRHHTGEDEDGFPALAVRYPELRPVLDKLERDHEMVDAILRRLAELLDALDGPDANADRDRAEAGRVRAELDGLTAILESHFGYEERQLVAAFDLMHDWDGSRPDFLRLGP